MILQSDDTLSIPVGYLQLKHGPSQKEAMPIDAIIIGILALVYQFKGMYITNVSDLAESFHTTEEVIKNRIELLSVTNAIKVHPMNNKFALTHGDAVKEITENAYAKRASFAKKMKGSI